MEWLRQHADYKRDDCLKWPMALDDKGYGMVSLGDVMWRAHRMMCTLAHGPAPSKKHEAAHSCGRGHQGCVNPRHLSWKTRAENQQDRVKHGTHGSGSRGGPHLKLKPEEVEAIRVAGSTMFKKDIARQFNVTPSTVIKILNGERWASSPPKQFSEDEVRAIRGMFGTVRINKIAEQYGVHRSVIDRIKIGKSYRYVS